MGCPLGFASEAALEDLGSPLRARRGGGAVLGSQGFWQHQVLRGLAARAARNIEL